MKRFLSVFLASAVALSVTMTGCASKDSSQPEANAGEITSDLRIGFAVAGKLGDQGFNDTMFEGIERFGKENGIEVTTVETVELQDNEIHARNFAQEGYNLVIIGNNAASELIPPIAADYPETHFVVFEGTVDGISNVTSLRTRIAEAGFLSGAFNTLMNEELGGGRKSAFVGGTRNAALERSQFSFTAGSEYVGGECAVVYIGNFTDVAKGKEIALNLFKNDLKLVQAYAGGAGMGVHQAAESMGEGYYSMGDATKQFAISPAVLASQVKNIDEMVYNACSDFVAGKLESGIQEVGLATGAVGITYAPERESKIPQAVKDEIKALEAKIISGEIVPPSTEAEYNEFAAKHLTK